jgi:hypothetical protein
MLDWRERRRIVAEQELRRSLQKRRWLGAELISALATLAAAVAAILSVVAAFRLERVTIEVGKNQERAAFESSLFSKQADAIVEIQASLHELSKDIDEYFELFSAEKLVTINVFKEKFSKVNDNIMKANAKAEGIKIVLGQDGSEFVEEIIAKYRRAKSHIGFNKKVLNGAVYVDKNEFLQAVIKKREAEQSAYYRIYCLSKIVVRGVSLNSDQINGCRDPKMEKG